MKISFVPDLMLKKQAVVSCFAHGLNPKNGRSEKSTRRVLEKGTAGGGEKGSEGLPGLRLQGTVCGTLCGTLAQV
jgi:hypothetical protein